MRHTNRQTTRRALTDLYRAIDHRVAVTITYLDHDGEETVRTIEAYDITTTRSGGIEVRAMCRLRKESRRFALDRIVSYTVHRAGYVLERPEATSPAGRVTVVVRSTAQVVARELGSDYHPRTRRQHHLAA